MKTSGPAAGRLFSYYRPIITDGAYGVAEEPPVAVAGGDRKNRQGRLQGESKRTARDGSEIDIAYGLDADRRVYMSAGSTTA